MPSQSYGEAGASSGPMGSVPFGQGQQLEKTQQAGNQAAAAQGAPPGGPGTGAPAPTPPAGGAPPQQPGQPDAQPPGAQPFQQAEPLQLPPPPPQLYPFRKFLADAARHPVAGTHLKALARMIGAAE